MISICYFVEHGHDDVDQTEHACERYVQIEISGVFEGDSPAKGEEHEEDYDDGIGGGVKEEVKDVKNSVLDSVEVGVDDVAEVFEEDGEETDPETDFQGEFYPVVALLLFLLMQIVKNGAG